MKKIIINIIACLAFFTNNANAKKQEQLKLTLESGEVIIDLLPEVAPNHVNRIKELVSEGFYDGLKFHRVIDGFMAQTGCPEGNGMGGSGKNLKAEFNNTTHKRGTVSMARANDINSGDSQFFICFNDCSFLDGQYTVWGQVSQGMEHVDGIKKGDPVSGTVVNPDKILKMELVK